MARTPDKLALADGDREALEKIARTRTEQAQRVDRARTLLAKADGEGIDSIAARLGVNRNTVSLCVRKYREGGLGAALADAPGRGRKAVIGDDDRAWVVSLGCTRPAELGYAAEMWTAGALAAHVRENAVAEGHPALARAAKSTVWAILEEAEVRPHKVRYYCERRDPDFDAKMHDALVVYEQVSFRFDDDGDLIPWDEEGPEVHTVSVDEKPGI